MTTSDIPEIIHLTAEQLLALRQNIDERLDAVRTAFTAQAAALGLVVTNGTDKKGKRATSSQRGRSKATSTSTGTSTSEGEGS